MDHQNCVNGSTSQVDMYRRDARGSRRRIGEPASASMANVRHSLSLPYDNAGEKFNEGLDTGHLECWANTAPVYIERSYSRGLLYPYQKYAVLRNDTGEIWGGRGPWGDMVKFSMGSTDHLVGYDAAALQNVPDLVEAVKERNDIGWKKDLIRLHLVVLGRTTVGPCVSALVVERQNSIMYRVGYATIPEEVWITIPEQEREFYHALVAPMDPLFRY